jgi:hypothetical protein
VDTTEHSNIFSSVRPDPYCLRTVFAAISAAAISLISLIHQEGEHMFHFLAFTLNVAGGRGGISLRLSRNQVAEWSTKLALSIGVAICKASFATLRG